MGHKSYKRLYLQLCVCFDIAGKSVQFIEAYRNLRLIVFYAQFYDKNFILYP